MDTSKRELCIKYEKLGHAGKQGTDFQIDVLTMVFLNSLTKDKNWNLSTENMAAGKFDDVVIQYLEPETTFLIQTKHKERRVITYEQLITDNSNDFSLPMYFCSYQEVKDIFTIKNVIICTNTNIHANVKCFVNEKALDAESPLHFGEKFNYYTFKESFIDDLRENINKFAKNLKNKKINTSDDSMRDFLSRLQLVVNYPTGENLHRIFENVIPKITFAQGLHYRNCKEHIQKRLNSWYIKPKGTCLTEMHGRSFFCEMRSNNYCEKLKSYDISFKNIEVSLKVSEKRQLHVISKQEYILSVIKICQVLQTEILAKVLFVSTDEKIDIQMHMLEAFQIPDYTHLVIACASVVEDSVYQRTRDKLLEVLKMYPYKTIIIISGEDNKFTREIKNMDFGVDTIEIREKISFSDLTEQSQVNFSQLNCIDFQGRNTNLKELLPTFTIQELCKAVCPETLVRIATKQKIKLGNKLDSLEDRTKTYYIHRSFNRNDKNIAEEEMYRWNRNGEEKITVICDAPGTGKSTVLTNLAIRIKENTPDAWVIKIDINHYSGILQKLKKKKLTSATVEELLNSQEITKMNSEFERRIFSLPAKVVLIMDGVDEISPEYEDIILNLLTGCKENSNYAKIFITTRPHLRGALENKLQVTSWTLEPFSKLNQMDFLENYWLVNLDVKDNSKKERCKVYTESLMQIILRNDNSLTEIPLQAKMLAEVLQAKESDEDLIEWETCEEFLTSRHEKPKLPSELYLTELYDMFVSNKFDLFVKYYKMLTGYGKIYEEGKLFHYTLALETVLSSKDCELFDCYKKKGEQNLLDKFPLKLGIVQKVDGRLCFIHRTYAEYFVAKCLAEQLKCETGNDQFLNFVVKTVLQRIEFTAICMFLDSSLLKELDSLPVEVCRNIGSRMAGKLGNIIVYQSASRGCTGILRLLFKCFQLAELDVDINSTEMYGENALHAAADAGNLNLICFLLEKGARINTKNIMDSTALRYAVKRCNLDVVKYLVENGAEVAGKSKDGRTAVHEAVSKNHLDMVKYLAKNGAHIDTEDNNGQTALHVATLGGHFSMVKYLVENGAAVDSKTSNGLTALHMAASIGHLDTVKYLVENGANINSTDTRGYSVLYDAASKGHLHIVEHLVETGAGVNGPTYKFSPLHEATLKGNLNIVKCLVENGADVDGTSTLQQAASSGNLDIVNYLVEKGANLAKRSEFLRTALDEAASAGHLHIVKYLVKEGADIINMKRYFISALKEAAVANHLDIVRYLLEEIADDRNRSKDANFPVPAVASAGSLNVVKYLVEKGVDVNVRDEDGNTAVIMSASAGHLEVVKYLVENGANVNSKNITGSSALHLAALSGHLHTVKYLVENGGDIKNRNIDGNTVLLEAVSGGHLHIVKYLVEENGADVNSKAMYGNTALRKAASLGNYSMVKYLVEKGADVNCRTTYGSTPLKTAAIARYPDIVQYLEEHGANK